MTSSRNTAQQPDSGFSSRSPMTHPDRTAPAFTKGPYEVNLRLCVGGAAPVIHSTATGAQLASLAMNPNMEADAFLFAAAPQMFEALVQAREWLAGWASAEQQLALIDAALSRAGGSNG